MADLTFNTAAGQVVERRLQMLFLNTGTSSTPSWSIIGKRVEDSSTDYDWGSESKTDILGNNWTSLKRPTITQSFDPCELDAGDPAQIKLWNLAIKDHDAAALSAQDVLVVHAYVTTSGSSSSTVTYFAERYSAAAIAVTGLGGSSNIGMPIEVTFSGERTTGSASISGGTVTFTADT